jgi:hypothetical protein
MEEDGKEGGSVEVGGATQDAEGGSSTMVTSIKLSVILIG